MVLREHCLDPVLDKEVGNGDPSLIAGRVYLVVSGNMIGVPSSYGLLMTL